MDNSCPLKKLEGKHRILEFRISSVGGTLDCRVGTQGFDFQGWTNTQGTNKITEKCKYCL